MKVMNKSNNSLYPLTSYDFYIKLLSKYSEKKLFTFYDNNKKQFLTGEKLTQKVIKISNRLTKLLESQDKAIILLPQGLEYISSLLGCFYANVIAIPTPIINIKNVTGIEEKIMPMINNSKAKCIITSTNFKKLIEGNESLSLSSILYIDDIEKDNIKNKRPRNSDLEDTALLLYTSGSTAEPKGVMLTHNNVMSQAIKGAEQWGMEEESNIVSWMPQFHNFGLFFNFIAPLFKGASSIILSPDSFAKDPTQWFEIIDKYKATHTASPNFAFDHCYSSLDLSQLTNISLSSLQAIICGGEPVRKETYEKFIEKFHALGLKDSIFCPHYGMSEVGSIATKPLNETINFLSLDVSLLQQGKIKLSTQNNQTKTVSNCGKIDDDARVLIVNPDTNSMCLTDEIGEIWIKSPSVAKGYLNQPKITEIVFNATINDTGEGGFFRTGDIGFIRDKNLFIIGREKDVMIIHGKNYHPIDIEWTIKKKLPNLCLPLCVFSCELDHQERIIVVIETTTSCMFEYKEISKKILDCISEIYMLEIYEVVIVNKGVIPKTESGKIQRKNCQNLYKQGKLLPLYQYRTDLLKKEKITPSLNILDLESTILEKIKIDVFSRILEVDLEMLDCNKSFGELGFDSIKYIRASKKIEELFNIQFEPVMLFKYPTINKLTRYLYSQIDNPKISQNQHSNIDLIDCSININHADTDIAIIGISCNFPGEATSPQLFWEKIINRKNCISTISQSRPQIIEDFQNLFGNSVDFPNKWGGFVKDVDKFDAEFFGISPLEAESMDPQQRKVMELTWSVIEDAGYDPSSLTNTNTGLYIGAHSNDYGELISKKASLINSYGAYTDSGIHMSLITNRVSRWFDFHGPSEVINTACSSSLVAIHRAVESIHRGECAIAIAGGINLIFSSRIYLASHKAGMLSEDGQCKTFDDSADGFVRSEGYGAVLLKPYKEALKDKDTIYGLIKGTSINHDGKSNSLRAPNLNAQKKLIKSTYQRYGIPSQTISYIETHGTGTALGDPIEIQAIKEAFQELGVHNTNTFCGLGSVKTVIGHTEAAAGIASLIKVLLSMKAETLPGILHFNKLNKYISLDKSPFYIVEQTQDWVRLKNKNGEELPRRAGISSFGYGGANAHIIVEEYSPLVVKQKEQYKNFKLIIPLSAKNRERLLANAQELLNYLEKSSDKNLNLHNLAYTLQVGRNHMNERVVFLAQNMQELKEKISFLIEGKKHIENCWFGNNNKNKDFISQLGSDEDLQELINKWISQNNYYKIAQCWTYGAEIKWDLLYKQNKPNRINLPTYSFAKTRYWIPESGIKKDYIESIHPLLHRNTSDLTEQRFTTIFTGQEFFLSDHIIKGQCILPGVITLEMARAAFEYSSKLSKNANNIIKIQDVIWINPIIIDKDPVETHIGLYPKNKEQIDYEIYTGKLDDISEHIQHAKGLISVEPAKDLILNLDAIKLKCNKNKITSDELYDRFRKQGINYGSNFKGVEEICFDEDRALAKLNLSFIDEDNLSNFKLIPGILDSAFQAASALLGDIGHKHTLPYSIKEMEIHSSCNSKMWAKIEHCKNFTLQDKINKFNITLCNNDGKVCIFIKELSILSIENYKDKILDETQVKTSIFYPEWEEKSIYDNENMVDIDEQLTILIEPDQSLENKILSWQKGIQYIVLKDSLLQLEERYTNYSLKLIKKIQNCIKENPSKKLLIQIVSSIQAQQNTFIGLSAILKTVFYEHPSIIGQFIGVDTWTIVTPVLLNRNSLRPWDTSVQYIKKKRYTLNWLKIKDVSIPSIKIWKTKGIYLITGGLGELGIIFAREIIEKVKTPILILSGRSPLNDEKKKIIAQLETEGAIVKYEIADVTQLDITHKLIQKIIEQFGRLDGIIHTAGVINDNYIINKTETEIKKILAAKVQGTVNLDRASQNIELDFFILFSSIAGSLGNPGQVDYAAANAFMDNYAVYRNNLVDTHKRYGHTLSLNWPLWEKGGMNVSSEIQELMKNEIGMLPMKTFHGLTAFYLAFASGKSQIMILEGYEEKIQTYIQRQISGVSLRSILHNKDLPISIDLSSDLLEEKAINYFKNLLSSIIRLPVKEIEADSPMEKYGIDSILIMQLTNRLEKDFGILSKTLFFEYKSLKTLTMYFLKTFKSKFIEILGLNQDIIQIQTSYNTNLNKNEIYKDQKSIKRRSRFIINDNPLNKTKLSNGDNIAIVGLAGRYPSSQNINDFWEILKNGEDCITEVPKERWDHNIYFDENKQAKGKTYTKWGGFIDGVDQFDPLFFNISPREAELIDPQERLFLQCVHETIEDAGYSRENLVKSTEGLKNGNIGVFVGVMFQEYQLYGAQEQVKGRSLAISGNIASIANRVSYYYDLHGPSMTIDTMCSSSLTALHLACLSLHNSDCNLAIAGGVNVSIHPNKYLLLAQGKFASSKGKCQSFGQGGDGYVPGEGVGAVLLKPLTNAIEDGNHIYGIIKATAINHGGKTNGYTVPNPNFQADVIEEALKKAQINPRTINYLEAHGTGTSLGDPIEITGLTKTFQKYTNEKQFCAIGSVKSNIGHCESAAGIAGLTKILLQMKHKQLAPSLHSKILNPNIDFCNSPFVVQQELAQWNTVKLIEEGKTIEYPRRAGLSSFGAGGANAHIIIEEYIPIQNTIVEIEPEKQSSVMIVLSAKDKNRLREYAENLLKYLNNQQFSDKDLINISYTLQVGRSEFEERLGLLVTSLDQLKDNLVAYIENKDIPNYIYQGRVNNDKTFIGALGLDDDFQKTIISWINKKKHAKLLELWVTGFNIDWENIYWDSKPVKISLPTYPFAREKYWIPKVEKLLLNNNPFNPTAKILLHPLLHENTSNLDEQRFSSTFSGNEFFFKDHIINGQKILPAAAYIEMIREAVERSNTNPNQIGCTVILKNIFFPLPLVAKDKLINIHVGLHPKQDGEIIFKIYNFVQNLDEKPLVYCQGNTFINEKITYPTFNIKILKEECYGNIIYAKDYYNIFNGLGLQYGPEHQAIKKAYIGNQKILAELSLHSKSDIHSQFNIHPGLLDAAFQASFGFMIVQGDVKLSLPIAIGQIEIYRRSTKKMWAYIRYSNDNAKRNSILKYDIDLCDENGFVCISIKEFAIKIQNTEITSSYVNVNSNNNSVMGELMLVPEWEEITIKQDFDEVKTTDRIIIFGASEEERLVILKHYPQAQILELNTSENIEKIARKLQTFQEINHVYWIAPDYTNDITKNNTFVKEQEKGVLLLFKMIKAFLNSGYGVRTLKWTIITKQARKVNEDEKIYPAHASLHGLGGSLAKEYTNWKIKMIDIENISKFPARDILSLPPDPKGYLYAYRQGRWYTEKMISINLPSNQQTIYKNKGVYIIIGGSGGIGEVWTEYMINTYMAHIVWIGRKEKDFQIQSKLDKLENLGLKPDYISADATNAQELESAYLKIKQKYRKIDGVIHSALVLADRSLAKMEEQEFRKVLSVKVDVSENIATIFKSENLDFILFFSSINSFEKLAGQSNYTAGCTFKDSFAEYLSQNQKCAVKVINWGYWGSVGAVASDVYRDLMARSGIGSIEPDEAMKVLETLLSSKVNQLAYIKTTKPFVIDRVNWEECIQVDSNSSDGFTKQNSQNNKRNIYTTIDSLSFKKNIFQSKKNIFPETSSETEKVTEQELYNKCVEYIKKLTGEILKMPSSKINSSEPLGNYGLDSVLIIQLTSSLNNLFDGITSSFLYDYQTVNAISEYVLKNYKESLITLLGLNERQENAQTKNTLTEQNNSGDDNDFVRKTYNKRFWNEDKRNEAISHSNVNKDIAIVGLSGRYAGANSIHEFWNNLKDGKNCISEIPKERWDWRKYFSEEKGKKGFMYTKWGGFIKDIDKFDPLFFHITPKEAELMDPQERLFLEIVYECIENAGYTSKNISENRKVGVFVGVMNQTYQLGTHYWSIANRISYLYNFQGPSMAVDTACSSSLTAINLALESIKSGACECAIAGGVNLIVTPTHLINLSSMTMLSSGDKCKAFGEQADGFVDGEGVGAIMLKPLNKALEDGDSIYGIVKSCVINSGGKTHGYTVPNPKAQSQLISEALKKANINARAISYIEAHGTGTALGDPIEISGLTQAFEEDTNEKQFCSIGSVKTNIGHCESAAGMAGLTKVLLQMKYRKLVPSLHSKKLNPNIDFEKTPFKVQQKLEEWKRPLKIENGEIKEYPRIAGVSAFGAGGSNAHIILQEYIYDNQ